MHENRNAASRKGDMDGMQKNFLVFLHNICTARERFCNVLQSMPMHILFTMDSLAKYKYS
jgi:hypothetical protein